MNSKSAIGFTASTLQHLLVDAGAVYKNYGLENEALIGCTSGGNEFDITPKTRQIKADGLKGSVKGLTQIVSNDVTLKVNMLEVTTDILKMALMADVDSESNPDYDIITGKPVIQLDDYIDNIALVGTISGSSLPIVIILVNALSSDGIKFSNKDESDNILPITFTANIEPTTPLASCYEIHYPKVITADENTFNVNETPVIDNAKVLLSFNDTLNPSVFKDGFAVTVAGVADVVTSIERGTNKLNTLLLTLTTAPTSGQLVTVAYVVPAVGAQITSLTGVALSEFASTAVINN